MARSVHRGPGAPRKVLQDRRALADRGGTAQRGVPCLGLSRPQCPRRRPRRGGEGSGLAGLPRPERTLVGGDALNHPATGTALAPAVGVALIAGSARGAPRAPKAPWGARALSARGNLSLRSAV